jgi:predicted nucleic acid-binding protein
VILVDTSIWIDHLRSGNPDLIGLLGRRRVLGHSWVTGELALGQLSGRREILTLLGNLPQATIASASEIMTLIENRHLHGLGIGFVDAQLLASTVLTTGASLWTSDKRLRAAATELAISGEPSQW